MKKKSRILLTAVFCLVLMIPSVRAANRVPEMEIDVALRPDGSALITQIWDAYTNTGTEFYLACNDSGYLSVTDLTVSDKNGPYLTVEDWDVDASFRDKAGKCGILDTKKGVELCWGISAYGDNRYRIQYVLHGLVGGYADADGFNHRFVDELTVFPTDVVLTIRNEDGTPLTDTGCDIWAFGFEGQIEFRDGAIRAWSREPLESGRHMTVMVALEKGLLSPVRTVADSFETVKTRAFAGSDYEEESVTAGEVVLLLVILLVFALAAAVLVTVITKVSRAKKQKRMEQAGYFRGVPNQGNLNVTYQLGRCAQLFREDALLGGYLMRLIAAGCLESAGRTGDGEAVRLRLRHRPESGAEYDGMLYEILEAAAGPEGILEPEALERYCAKNYEPMSRFMNACLRDGRQTLLDSGCLKKTGLEHEGDLTPKGQQELDQVYGLRNYLLEICRIGERGLEEAVLWRDYMVYALMLGIADKLEAQLRDLYPDRITELDMYRHYVLYAGYYNRRMYGSYAREKTRRTAGGSGGSVSMGGGGGFSGGGGGGTR